MSEDATYEMTEEAPFSEAAVIEPIHVVVDGKQEQSETPEFGSWTAISWPAGTSLAASAQRILPQNRRRSKAEVIIAAPQAGQSQTATGTVTSPAAGQTIASMVLPAGLYTVQWSVGLGGTTGAAEQNNFQLLNGATVVEVSMNGTGSGSVAPQSTVQILVPSGGATVQVQAIALGTVGAVYRAQMTAVGIASGTAMIGSRAQVMTGSGASLPPGRYPIENAQELWAGSDNANPMSILVLDQRYL